MTTTIEAKLATARERYQAAMAARDAAAKAVLEGDDKALGELRTRRGEVRAAEDELADLQLVVEADRRARKADAQRAARKELQEAIGLSTVAAIETRPTIARRMVALAEDLRGLVAEWDAATEIVHNGFQVPDEHQRRENFMRSLMRPCEDPLGGLLAVAVPRLARVDLRFQGDAMAKVDWPAAVEAVGRKAVHVLESQLNDLPNPEAA